MTDDLPPWQPIAAWLTRIIDAVEDPSQVEPQAKAIAYDQAVADSGKDIEMGTPSDPTESQPDLRQVGEE